MSALCLSLSCNQIANRHVLSFKQILTPGPDVISYCVQMGFEEITHLISVSNIFIFQIIFILVSFFFYQSSRFKPDLSIQSSSLCVSTMNISVTREFWNLERNIPNKSGNIRICKIYLFNLFLGITILQYDMNVDKISCQWRYAVLITNTRSHIINSCT